MKKRNYLLNNLNCVVMLLAVFALACLAPNPLWSQVGKTSQVGNGTPQVYNHAGEPVIRCHTMEADAEMRALHPEMGSFEDLMNWLNNATKKFEQDVQSGNKVMAVTTLPIVFHIIYDGEPVGVGSNIAAALVDAQIEQLNNDFRKIAGTSGDNANPAGADAEVEFCAAMQDPGGNAMPEPGIDRIDRNVQGWAAGPYGKPFIEGTIKPTTQWDPDKYMNIWVCGLTGGLLGYAQFPDASGLPPFAPIGGPANTDGVVCGSETIGSTTVPNPNGAPYNMGRTATHEIGHWLGLTHIWGDGDCSVDDFVADTPNAGAPNFGCPAGTDSCPLDAGFDMIENYMDYTDDACMNIVTLGQKARIQTVLMNSPRRGILGSSMVCMPVSNDDVCNAFPLTIGIPINANGATATAQVGEVNPGVGTDGGDGCNATDGWCNYPGNGEPGIHNSLWFTFVAPPSGYVDINTDNTDDAQIAIWSVGDCSDFGTFTLVAANDDGGPGFAPALCTDVIPGNTYYLQIDGFDGFPYNTNITVSETSGPAANDECINAEPITCGSTVFGNTANACSDPDLLGFCGTSDGVGTGVWYTFTGDGSRVTLTTCNPGTDYDTKLRVWSGSCGALNCVAGNDDTNCSLNSLASRVQFCSTPGEQYFILVHGFQANEGNFELSMTCDMELVLTCPADISILCGDPNDPGVAGEATANTNVCCPNPPTITYADVTAANFLSITRTWTATYDCGLVLTCDQIITLIPSTYNGNVAFFTQAQVDAWPGCYSTINGHVQINGANITNLNTLQNLTTITGGLTIQSTALSNMTGLDNLTNVGGTLTVLFNSSLASLAGMESLASVGGGLYLYYNFALDDCCAIKDLINGGVIGPVVVFFNKVGCNSAIEILNGCGPGMAPLIGNTGGINTASSMDTLTSLSLFPNPAKNEVNVQFERTAPFATLRLMDMLGRVIFEKELEEGMDRLTIDLSNGQFDNGLYLVSFMENGEMVSKQLVVQR